MKGATEPYGSRGWISGEGVPTNKGNLAQNGFHYLDLLTGDVYLKIHGGWDLVGNLQGPQGAIGPTGLTGADGAQGPAGADGTTPAFRGALVTHSTFEALGSAGSVNILAFDQEEYDTDSIHDTVTNNSRLTVPLGVSKVRLAGMASISDADARKLFSYSLDILKNGNSSYIGRASKAWQRTGADAGDLTNGLWDTVNSPVLSVTPGDYFELGLYLFSSDSSPMTVQGTTNRWFAMEIVE